MTMESVRRVALVATTRTGSTWLGALLDSHPEIRFRGEIFNLEHATAAAVLDPEAYLDEALSAAGPRVGFLSFPDPCAASRAANRELWRMVLGGEAGSGGSRHAFAPVS
jgi:hypothetical protein